MIKSFGDNETQKIWLGERSKRLPNQIQHIARRKLRMINAAVNINDLRIPPANRLEKLKSDWRGHYSIRINDQWRIVFKWHENDAFKVQIVDYHG
jgi:proteic killer suppression protein